VLGSIAVIAAAALAGGLDMRIALITGMALSLSSTALALQPLTERGALATQGGQAGFAICFPGPRGDPVLAVLPLLGTAGGWSGFTWQALGFAVAAIVGTLVLGHFLARPVFRHIARTRLREIFTAFALLLVLGIALVFEAAGLSMALGAFLAGVLLASRNTATRSRPRSSPSRRAARSVLHLGRHERRLHGALAAPVERGC